MTTRLIVVGAGLIGRKHIELVSKHAVLAAVVDPEPNSKVADTPWFGDLAACLGAVNADGVIVATPNGLHLAHGRLCLEAGLPVLMEKPLADSVASGAELAALADKTGVPILVGHHRRHSNVIKTAKALIDSGRFGKLAAVNAMFLLNKPDDYFQMHWRTKAGGGPTYINLIHDIDLLQHFCGPITRVQARESHAVRGFEVEDTSAAILEFESGVLGTVTISDAVSSPWSWELTSGENPIYPKTDQSCYMIAGTKGSISLPDLTCWTHDGPQSWWSPIEREQLTSAPHDPVAAQLVHFLGVIKGATPLVSAREGLRNIAVLDAIKAAATSGRPVDVALA